MTEDGQELFNLSSTLLDSVDDNIEIHDRDDKAPLVVKNYDGNILLRKKHLNQSHIYHWKKQIKMQLVSVLLNRNISKNVICVVSTPKSQGI